MITEVAFLVVYETNTPTSMHWYVSQQLVLVSHVTVP